MADPAQMQIQREAATDSQKGLIFWCPSRREQGHICRRKEFYQILTSFRLLDSLVKLYDRGGLDRGLTKRTLVREHKCVSAF